MKENPKESIAKHEEGEPNSCACNEDHALHLALLSKSIFELSKQIPVDQKAQLKLTKEVVFELADALEDCSDYPREDMGVTFIEYLEFKLMDDGTDPTGWTKGYEEQVEEMLQETISHLKK